VKKAYIDALAEIVDGKTDVIGFVYCINGEINSAEVYNNRNLFRALWPKLLDSAITEAVADCPADGTTPQVSARQISTFFHTALAGATKERQLWKTTAVKTYTTPTTLLFETFDCTDGKVWVHKSFVNRGKDQVSVPLDSNSRQSIQQRERN
jgi:hypothetical protein